VRFREKIFLRLVKDASLKNENIKKDIDSNCVDVFSNLLQQIVDDYFDQGFISECLGRLETHPETLYMNMDNEMIVKRENLQNQL